MKRISRKALYMGVAELFAQRSICKRLGVGAVAVKGNRIIASGYNGPLSTTLSGDDKCDCDINYPCTISIHAEANLIAFCAKNGIPLAQASLYLTYSPCMKCAELIIQAGIVEVIYKETFRDLKPLDLLSNNGVLTHLVDNL